MYLLLTIIVNRQHFGLVKLLIIVPNNLVIFIIVTVCNCC
jgi:hypothetical protein